MDLPLPRVENHGRLLTHVMFIPRRNHIAFQSSLEITFYDIISAMFSTSTNVDIV